MATINGTSASETIDEAAREPNTFQSNTINALAGNDLIIALRKSSYSFISPQTGQRVVVNYTDTINGGNGVDTYRAQFGDSWSINLAGFSDNYGNGVRWAGTFTGVEQFDITATGAGSATFGAGDDRLSVGGGAVTAAMDAGTDRLVLDYGFVNARTSMTVERSGTFADGYSGEYFIAGSYARATFSGVEHFTITTSAQGDIIVTGDGDDVVTTNGGNDTVTVDRGVDAASGGDGVDALSISFADEVEGVTLDLRLGEGGAQQSGGTGSIVGFETFVNAVTGSAFDDVLVETVQSYDAQIAGGDGDDRIQVSAGADTIDGGANRDRLVLDFSWVNARTSLTAPLAGSLEAGYSARYFIAGSYATATFSGIEDLTILTSLQGDTIVTGDGDDIVSSEGGADSVTVGKGADVLDGGAGVDALSIDLSDEASGVTIDLRLEEAQQSGGTGSITGFETFVGSVSGSGGDDVLIETAQSYDAQISAGAGNDVVQVSAGTDTIAGGANRDRLVLDFSYINARTSLTQPLTGSLADGYAGQYFIAGSYATATFMGIEDLTVLTSDQGDTIIAGDGDDVVASAGGADTVTLATGADTAAGGDGVDALSISFADETAGVTLDLRIDENGEQQSGGTGSIKGFETFHTAVAGSRFDDVLIETAVARDVEILAGEGADRVQVSAGVDRVDGGGGRDRLVLDYRYINSTTSVTEAISGSLTTGYSGKYFIAGSYATTTLLGIEDFTILTSEQGDTIVTGDGDDIVASAGGSDTVTVGRGNDALDGGAGTDALSIDLGDETAGVTIDLRLTGAQQVGGSGSITGFESFVGAVTGGDGNDVLIETTAVRNASFATGRGDDLVQVSAGSDTVAMGAGNDRLVLDYSYINARTSMTVALANDPDGGLQGTYFIAGSYATTAFSGVENLTILTSNQGDALVAGNGDDVLASAGGADLLTVGRGIDTVDGGDGTDALSIDLSDEAAGVTINLLATGAQQAGGTGSITGVESFVGAVIGSRGNDVLIEGVFSYDAQFATGEGNDRVQVSAGTDNVSMGTGSDRLVLDYSYINARTSLTEPLTGTLTDGYAGEYFVAGSYARTTFSGVEHFTIATSNQGDTIVVGDGDDVIATNGGNDAITAGAGLNMVSGGDGTDSLSIDFSRQARGVVLDLSRAGAQLTRGDGAVSGIETFAGAIVGTRFADTLVETAVAANAVISGGAGDDRVQVSAGTDTVDGGANSDRLVLDYSYVNSRTSMTVALSGSLAEGYAGEYFIAGAYARTTFSGIESFTITTSAQADTLRTGDGADVIVANGGADDIATAGGVDVIDGGDGDDRIDGGIGDDRMTGGAGNDTFVVDGRRDAVLEAVDGGDDLVLAGVSYRMAANVERLTLTGDAAIDGTGNDLANTITGNAGANALNGGKGADTMIGGLGDDLYYVDDARDVVTETATGGTDTVNAAIDYVLGATVENLVLSGAALRGTGNDGANRITGGRASEALVGLGGADTLSGGLGNDTIDGGEGDDLIVGGVGRDVLTGGGGGDAFRFVTGDLGDTPNRADVITDFRAGGRDRIDFSRFDAVEGTAAVEQFRFIGTGTFTGAAGELRYAALAGDTLIQGDTDGDGLADVMLRLTGAYELVRADFFGVTG